MYILYCGNKGGGVYLHHASGATVGSLMAEAGVWGDVLVGVVVGGWRGGQGGLGARHVLRPARYRRAHGRGH